MHINFFWSQTPLCLQLWIEILIATSKLFGSSKQMVQVVSSVRDNLCESFPIFYLSIHVWNHGILINLVIFRLQMFFYNFKRIGPYIHAHDSSPRSSIFFPISGIWPHIELHNVNIIFFINYVTLLIILAVKIWFIPNKSFIWNKVVKYTKLAEKNTKT